MTLLVTLLTGGRPGLLGRTVRALETRAPDLVEKARIVALVNGNDAASHEILRARAWVDEIVHWELGRLPIGGAISVLMERAGLGREEYLLHLEDDWECGTAESSWVERALAILRTTKNVGQVRLRGEASRSCVGAAVSRYHMVTGARIDWQVRDRGRHKVARAHYTFNPTLVPTAVARRVFPCDSEMHAAQKFGRTKLMVAQLVPGAFRHIGGKDSLRERTARA